MLNRILNQETFYCEIMVIYCLAIFLADGFKRAQRGLELHLALVHELQRGRERLPLV